MKLASEALKLDFTAVSPLKGLKKIFNLRTLKDFFKTLLYLGTFTLAAIIFWFRYRTIIVRLIYVEPAEMFHLWGRMLHGFLVTMIIAILVILIIDALCEFFLWRKELKMDKKEVEREDREQNGNREIKSRRRQLHEELLTSDMRNDIRQSSVVIANPTHIAVCLYVNKAVTFIPFISVMEKDEKALAVRRYAEKLNIPVVEDVALAREIYRTHSRHSFISMQQLEPVMDILLWLEGVDARWAEIVAANRKKNEGSNSASDSENPPNIQ
jgi:type III secretion protein U